MRVPYDDRRDPPAPVLPIRIGPPRGDRALLLRALVDTGADATIIPEDVARGLRLPVVSFVRVRGIGPAPLDAAVYGAEIEAAGVRRLIDVVGLGRETLLGRNVLNDWTITLRGPEKVMEISGQG